MKLFNSDVVIYITPVVFGGYSSELKKAMDRIIPLLLESMAAGTVPAWMYTLIGSFGWKRQARANKAHKQMYARPYLKG